MSIKPIVYVLGVEGHFYLAKALKEEFQRPVVGIISRERVHEMMTPERRKIFDEVYSLPDFFFEHIAEIRAMPLNELNDRQTALEKELGIDCSALLTHQDRDTQQIGDYRKVRNWQLCNLMFIKHFLSKVDPAFVLDGVIIYLQLALRAACEKRDIPYLLSMGARGKGFSFYHTNGHQIGMQDLFEEFQKGNYGIVDNNILEQADAFLESFVKKPERPHYAKRNSLVGFNWKIFRQKLEIALNPSKLFPSYRVRNLDFYMGTEFSFFRIFVNSLVGRFRKTSQTLRKVFDSNPDLSQPYIYVPLHFTPEISDLYFGTEYDHHESFICRLSNFAPSDCLLYVKEHTSMIGRRPDSFYAALSRRYNVRLIHPSVDTFDLIKNAKATLTVTGTPAWEAFLLGKPSIVLGDVFFENLPGVLKPSLGPGFSDCVRRYLESFSADLQTIKNGYRAYFATVYEGDKVDIGYTSSRSEAKRNAECFAQALNGVIRRCHIEMQGKFPAELVDADAGKRAASR